MAILLHDGLCWTSRLAICHVHPHDTTRLSGTRAFSGSLRGLKLVPAKGRCLVPPTSTPKGHNANRWAANCVKIQQDAGRYLFLLVQ